MKMFGVLMWSVLIVQAAWGQTPGDSTQGGRSAVRRDDAGDDDVSS